MLSACTGETVFPGQARNDTQACLWKSLVFKLHLWYETKFRQSGQESKNALFNRAFWQIKYARCGRTETKFALVPE